MHISDNDDYLVINVHCQMELTVSLHSELQHSDTPKFSPKVVELRELRVLSLNQ